MARSRAQDAPDSFAPWQFVKSSGKRQHLPPETKIGVAVGPLDAPVVRPCCPDRRWDGSRWARMRLAHLTTKCQSPSERMMAQKVDRRVMLGRGYSATAVSRAAAVRRGSGT